MKKGCPFIFLPLYCWPGKDLFSASPVLLSRELFQRVIISHLHFTQALAHLHLLISVLHIEDAPKSLLTVHRNRMLQDWAEFGTGLLYSLNC